MYICKYEYKTFLKKINVTGIGLGYKIKNSFNTGKKCIKVFVNSKINKNMLIPKDIIPKFYKGIVTDVVEIGEVKTLSFTNKIRPVPGGYSIGTSQELSSGTLACLVTDGKFYYVLSNSHILNPKGQVPINTPIIQPGKRDYGKAPEDIIAKLSKFIPINLITATQVIPNYVDCAIGMITKRSQVYTKIAIIGKINGIKAPNLNEEVKKVGRISELTTGKIIALGTTQLVNYMRGKALFKDQIVTTSMSVNGDSGALLLDKSNFAIGLLFAGNESVSYFNPIQSVLNNLNVSIVK